MYSTCVGLYQGILTALADATSDLPMPYNEQRTGAATAAKWNMLPNRQSAYG